MSYKNGKEWATASVRTATVPAKLELTRGSLDDHKPMASICRSSLFACSIRTALPAPTAKNVHPLYRRRPWRDRRHRQRRSHQLRTVPIAGARGVQWTGAGDRARQGGSGGKITVRAESAALDGCSALR